jgi:hypothetical protein
MTSPPGRAPHQAIIEATLRRARPVVLTALAAILAMIPLARNLFWEPMAVTIMGGLLVATVPTLLVVPALYVLWFTAILLCRRRSGGCYPPRCRSSATTSGVTILRRAPGAVFARLSRRKEFVLPTFSRRTSGAQM